MKKSLLILLVPTLLLGSCTIFPSKNNSSSTTTNGQTSGDNPTTNTSSDTDTDTSDTDSSTDDDSATPPVVTKQTISQIKVDSKIGQMVQFDATYLRNLTWTNEDLMYFADANDYIWFRVPYTNYTGYLANRERMKEYTVTGKLAKVNDIFEVQFDSSITNRESVVNLGDTYPLSYNPNNVATAVSGIAEIKAKSGQITLNNKGHGAGEIVKFTSQLVQTEYEDANKKAMVLDADGNTITVIADERKMVNQDDIGKYYTWVGIISIKTSIPAIMGLSCEYVAHTTEEETHVNVDAAQEVSPEYFKNWNLTSSKYNPAPNNTYFQLFMSTGYIVDNSDITTSYNFGMVANYGGSLSDAGSTNTVKGFYLVNCTGLNENKLEYCPVAEYVGKNIAVTLYYAIRQYDTSNHIWEMFVIEDLIETA